MIPLAVQPAYIPQAMRARNAWVVWRMEPSGDRVTKVPYDPKTGFRARSDATASWTSFTNALSAYTTHGYDGIGLMLAGGDITCIDLDHCIIDGILEPWAEAIIAKVDSYTETSQSGEGVHIFVRGTPPAGRRRKGVVEMYGPDDNRYIAVTGRVIDGRKVIRACDLDALHADLFPHDSIRSRLPLLVSE